MAMSCSPPLLKIVCFCSTSFIRFYYEVGVISYKVDLSFASGYIFFYSVGTSMSACRSILCPIVVLLIFVLAY